MSYERGRLKDVRFLYLLQYPMGIIQGSPYSYETRRNSMLSLKKCHDDFANAVRRERFFKATPISDLNLHPVPRSHTALPMFWVWRTF